MNSYREDGKGFRAAFEIACESEKIATRLQISLTSNSSEGLILTALMGGYLKKSKRLFLFKLILFLVKTTARNAFGYCSGLFFKAKHSKARLTKL